MPYLFEVVSNPLEYKGRPTPRIDPELRAKWVAALRSGDYMQGSGRLYNDVANLYCCLGVLCNIHPDFSLNKSVFTYLGSSTTTTTTKMLPYAFADSLGVTICIAIEELGRFNLASFNDQGFTFDQIADIIDYFL